jgi:hypothetical protein
MRMRHFAVLLCLSGLAPMGFAHAPVAAAWAADTPAKQLEEALLLPELLEVMQQEGATYGADLGAEYFPDNAGADWQQAVAALYAPSRLLPIFETAFEGDLARTTADTDAMLAFLTSPFGKKITRLEISARRALLDDSVDAAARQRLDEMRIEAPPRLQLLEDFAEAGHLVEMNIASALNANVAFLQGLAASGATDGALSDAEILDHVWGQENEVRVGAEDWMMTFMILAYQPLSDDEISAYAAFSRSPAGVTLNRALFAGFDAMFLQTSKDMGQAVGRWIQGTSL